MPLALIDFLNSREDAAVLWAVAILVFVLVASRGAILSSFVDVLRALALKLVLVFGAAAAYCAVLVYVAERAGLWHRGTLRETVYWFALGGTVITANAIEKSPRGFVYLRETLRRGVCVTIVAEFIVNLYVLSIFFELLLVPIFLWLAYAQVAGTQKLAKRQLPDTLTTYLGFFVIGYVALKAATDLDRLLTRETLEGLLVAPALTVAFVPFLAGLGWIVRREQENLRKRFRARQRLIAEPNERRPQSASGGHRPGCLASWTGRAVGSVLAVRLAARL
jgi:hypothetical protein